MAGLLLLGTGITAVVYTIEHSIQPAKKAATAYIGALQAGRYADAYEMQCAEDQTGKNAFVLRWSRQLAAGHNISSFTVHGVSLSNVNGRSEAEVGIDVIYEDGTHSSTVLPLIKKASKWQPCP